MPKRVGVTVENFVTFHNQNHRYSTIGGMIPKEKVKADVEL